MKRNTVTSGETFLRCAFFALWWRLGARGDPDSVFDDLVKRYGEEHRRYHTFAHIEHCMRELESVRHLVRDTNAVELFIFFHDVVYNAKGSHNEIESSLLFRAVAQAAGLSQGIIDKVEHFIFMSLFHRNLLGDPDCALALDIDMAILGAEASVYDAYTRGVREEFCVYTDEEFAMGRMDWIRKTLDKKNRPIFLTEVFRKKYEERAEANLKEELAQLQNLP